eukprot:scaffold7089_cov79-Cylindrotheca_fusiformis.AAC.1
MEREKAFKPGNKKDDGGLACDGRKESCAASSTTSPDMSREPDEGSDTFSSAFNEPMEEEEEDYIPASCANHNLQAMLEWEEENDGDSIGSSKSVGEDDILIEEEEQEMFPHLHDDDPMVEVDEEEIDNGARPAPSSITNKNLRFTLEEEGSYELISLLDGAGAPRNCYDRLIALLRTRN